MIAAKIRSAVHALKSALRTGELPLPTFEASMAELEDAAAMADAMERRRVPARLRVVGSNDAADPVVSLDAWRRRIPAAPRRRPAGPQGGPAA